MIRRAAALTLSLSLLGIAACSPTSSYQGFQAVETQPADVKAGTDTRSTVLAKLGTPTATSTFDKNVWFYMSQSSNKTAFYHPRVTKRNVVAIAFDKENEQVLAVNTYTLKDGRVIAYNARETPTRGREMTVLEQLVGSIGAGSLLPLDDVNPGTRGSQGH